AKTPARLSFKEGDAGRCELRAKGYKSAFFPCGYDSPPSIYMTLEKLKTGFVSFRFFPADSVLLINDREIETQGGNVVEYELPEGEYMLKVASKDGAHSKTKKFTVKEGEKSLLGTIDLTEKM
ncbi:MAG: hypothetical protein FJ088_01320, partial [Deltaproteobacteria bacterium]|nr:hypothetical protein [Deltaproteobacteria bacterium]